MAREALALENPVLVRTCIQVLTVIGDEDDLAAIETLLRQMERDGVVHRLVHHQVPPKVEYSLTDWGQALCPALDALLKWVDLKKTLMGGDV